MDANSIHASQAFKDDCHAKEQQINFNGICEHHQNGVAQHSIQILVGRARKNSYIQPTICHVADLQLLPFVSSRLSMEHPPQA